MMVLSKLRFPFICTGKFDKNQETCPKDVYEQYKAAQRTKSYMEISDKVESRVRRKSFLNPPSSVSHQTHLSESILQPKQETLVSMIQDSKFDPLIISYFQTSFEACNTCGLLLQNLYQVRHNYKLIQSVMKLSNGISDHRSYTNAQLRTILDELALFTISSNMPSYIKPDQFRDIHNNHGSLLQRLMTKFRMNQQNRTSPRYWKLRNKLKTRTNEGLGLELEVAAKGVFIMINEFDTMSRLVKRLQDEIEHNIEIADMCVKNGRGEMLIEIVKEFRIHQFRFLDQLEELEEHIYLCFLTINRSRMLVLQETMVLEKD